MATKKTIKSTNEFFVFIFPFMIKMEHINSY